jgi:chitodextrinase
MRALILHAKTLLVVPLLALALAGCPGGGAPTAGAGGGGGGGSTIPIPPPDTNPPSAPTGFNATPAGSTSIDLDWNASTDDVGVTAYIVTRNGTQIATPAVTSFLDTGLIPATTYNYTVRARDAAGNLSNTTAASGQTAAASGDASPPTAPTNLTATAAGSSVINLSWTASTDNVGVTNYIVRRDGAAVATPTATSFSDTGLSAATLYSYTVEARDAAGNVSAPSNGASATTSGATGTLPLGNLVHDGPATPEQISLFLPVTGALPQTATAAVRYRQTGSPTWITGHPLHRIRPTFSMTPAVGSVPDAFAWPIIDLAPGTSYDIEVTVTSGATTEVKTLTHTTRALPAAAGPVTTTILPGSTANTISSVINSSASGNVIEIPNGTYTLTNSIQINRSGTLNNPIYIRGQSRAGVVLSNPGRVFQIQNASNVVIENLTIQGSGVDSGTNASSEGISFFDGTPNQSRVTIRNVVMNGVDKAIVASAEIQEFLAYDNTLNGNNLWISAFIDSNLTWNDDGVRIPGFGNCAFNNTLKGFGDTLAYAMHSGADTLTQSIGVHFYRNDILSGGDDLTEADHSHRNNTFYDNRARNTMTFLSLDPIYGGPLLVARNISVNTGRSPLKMNSENSGQFIYNNTIIRTTGRSPHNVWGQVQFNNGDQQSWGYRNNLLVYRGITSGGLLAHESGGNDFVDFTHNSWFPNSRVLWSNSGGSFNTIALAFAGLPATTPLFSGSTQRHFQDNITISNPWTVTVTLGTDYLTEITSPITPALSAGTTPKNTGAVIPNITDGFSGAAPDRGAIIGGRAIPTYGDRTP